jgi:hypothetical protein
MIHNLSSRVRPISLWVAILTIPIAPVQAQMQIPYKIGIPLYDVADLTVKSVHGFAGEIAVSGILQCSSEQVCWFQHPTKPQLRVEIVFSASLPGEKQRLLDNCTARTCGELLVGTFHALRHSGQFLMLR